MSDKDNKLIFEGYQQISELRRGIGNARRPGSKTPDIIDVDEVKKKKPGNEKLADNIKNTAGKVGRGVRYATDLFSRDKKKSGWAAMASGVKKAADWAKGQQSGNNKDKDLTAVGKALEKINKGEELTESEFISLYRYQVNKELSGKGQQDINDLLNKFGKERVALTKYFRDRTAKDESYKINDFWSKTENIINNSNIESAPNIVNFADPEYPKYKFAIKVKDIVSRNYFYKPLTSIEHLVQFIGDGLHEYIKKGYNIAKSKEVLGYNYDSDLYRYVMNNYLPDIIKRL